MNQPQVRPFQCVYTPQVPELLNKLGCTIAISTYQAGKVVFISVKDDAGLIQLPRSFDKAMGIAEDVANDKIAIASRAEKANEAGVLILHVPNKTLVGKIIYQTSLDEIYDVHVLANKSRPNIMNTLNKEHQQGLTTPMSTYWQRENPQQN